MLAPTNRKVTLIILDGFGLHPDKKGNAIVAAKTPNFEAILANSYTTALTAFGAEVGLTWGNMGNSEVGHLNLGTGRVIMQDFPRINEAIDSGKFESNEAIFNLADQTSPANALHVIGLISDGGVHGDWKQTAAVVKTLRRVNVKSPIWLHMIADGRDTPPKDFDRLMNKFFDEIKKTNAQAATVVGRFYALDRDNRWERTREAYEAIVNGKGRKVGRVDEVTVEAYKNQESDEFIQATIIGEYPGMKPGDGVFITNFRPDRIRQLTRSLADPQFKKFSRTFDPSKLHIVTMTNYGLKLGDHLQIAFDREPVHNTLAETASSAGLKQMHIAETEKYAHVTYFFNGGREKEFPGEDRVLVPSPKVKTYDKAPEMSAANITSEYMKAVKKNYDLIVMNFANCDMVGHTGDYQATVKAVEAIDQALGKIKNEADKSNRILLITADHGNAEQMLHAETGEINKEHTVNPVPLILYDPHSPAPRQDDQIDHSKQTAMEKLMNLKAVGVLADVAATVIALLGKKIPDEMSGISLLETLNYSPLAAKEKTGS